LVDLAFSLKVKERHIEMKTNRTAKQAKPERELLLNVARTIGSTLGKVAAKTGVVTKPSARHARAKKARPNGDKARGRRRV